MKILVITFGLLTMVKGQGVKMFDLPAGIMEVLPGGYKTGFSCEGRIYGYYADPFNDCQVFHVCVPPDPTKGNSKTLQYPFFCVKDTKFNQKYLICDYAKNVDCAASESFYSVNEQFGKTSRRPQPVSVAAFGAIPADKPGEGSTSEI